MKRTVSTAVREERRASSAAWVESGYAGLWAGMVFALAQMLAAALGGASPWRPWDAAASVVLGRFAFGPFGPTPLYALIVHFSLSFLFGALYGAVLARARRRSREGLAFEAGLGAAYGLLLWAVNFQLLARFVAPWFLAAPQAVQALLHAFFFGLPLGVLVARRGVRRARHRLRGAVVG